MKSILISTVTGPERPGTMCDLAGKTREVGGEWLICKVSNLDGQLAGLMKLSIDKDLEDTLKTTVENDFPYLHFSWTHASQEKLRPRVLITMEIDCLDRPGLTRTLSDLLYSLDIVVENMESTRHPVGAVSSTLYSTRLSLAAPKEQESSRIAEKIEEIDHNIRVRIID